MKVRALTSFCSDIIVPAPGQEFEVADAQARDWIKAGLVVPAESAKREKAVSTAREKRG